VDQATDIVRDVEGVLAVDGLRLRWIGHSLHAEVDVTADPGLTLTAGHDLAHHAEAHLMAYLHRLDSATVHVGPAGAHQPQLTDR
jgi:divalent metal cation (Fe/Co/Zn/Cd) transporter